MIKLLLLSFFAILCLGIFDVKRKFIFTHPPKCGGTSIEILLLGLKEFNDNDSDWRKWKHATLDEHVDEVKRLGYNPDDFYIFNYQKSMGSCSIMV